MASTEQTEQKVTEEVPSDKGSQGGLPSNVECLESKAISMLFTKIRSKDSSNEEYVLYADRLCRILAEEGLARLSSGEIEIETPCGVCIYLLFFIRNIYSIYNISEFVLICFRFHCLIFGR